MNRKLEKALRFCADLLFPPRCVLCDGIVAPGASVCEACAAQLERAEKTPGVNLRVCGQNIPCTVLYPYEGRVRDSILRFKFGGRRQYAEFYGERLARAVRRELPPAGLVTAVPLSERRRRERGYNQSELVARRAAAALGLPYAACLKKAADNRPQHLLGREERARNVRGVYRPLGGCAAGKQVLLIDDIVTTGATLAACCEALLAGGAASVACAAVARTPEERVEKRPAM